MNPRRGWVLLVSLSGVSMLGGCAWFKTLDVQYPDTAVSPALLASVAPQRVVVGPVGDRRADKTRIGAKPQNGDAILTRRPVTEIVREALVLEVAKNGHVVVPEAGDIRVAANVEEFWLDVVGRKPTALYVGRVAIALVVSDGRTGEPLLTRRYVGIKRREAEADSRAVSREVLDAALARTVHDVATDPELVATLARLPKAASRPDRN